MTPKDVLVLLDIVDKSAKSPAYSHITSAAHEALVHAQLVALHEAKKHEESDESPPTKKGGK